MAVGAFNVGAFNAGAFNAGAFNAGASHTSAVMELLAIEQSEITQAYYDHRDSVRCSDADRVLGHDAKARRKQKGDRRKLARANAEHEEGTSYMTGGATSVKLTENVCSGVLLLCCVIRNLNLVHFYMQYFHEFFDQTVLYLSQRFLENTFFPVCK